VASVRRPLFWRHNTSPLSNCLQFFRIENFESKSGGFEGGFGKGPMDGWIIGLNDGAVTLFGNSIVSAA
jgi:hypothetical protein